jgi:DNA adenine methylase
MKPHEALIEPNTGRCSAGRLGEKTYGEGLPPELGLTRVELDGGRSAQATLLGRDERTVESLYLSPKLAKARGPTP